MPVLSDYDWYERWLDDNGKRTESGDGDFTRTAKRYGWNIEAMNNVTAEDICGDDLPWQPGDDEEDSDE